MPQPSPHKFDAQDVLRHGEDQFRLLVEQVLDYAIFMLNPDGTVASWNSGAERLKGYREDEILGKHFSIFYTPEDVAACLPQRALEAAARDGHYELLGWRVRKDRSRFWADVVITALHDGDGKLRGFAKVTRDFTERRAAEEALKQHAEALARSNAELEHYAYIASHDLQEPVRTIVSFTQLLQAQFGESLPPKAQEYIQFAVDAATRMRELVKGLLEHARAGSAKLTVENVDSNYVLQTVLSDMAATINHADAKVTVDRLPTVRADRRGLAQVFQNLISNAVKFRADAPPAVHISAERQAEYWRFAVSDNGIGIDPKYADRLFQLFQRLHSGPAYPGSGLGLAICKQTIERMGGRIWLRSARGNGATFYFTLPAVAN